MSKQGDSGRLPKFHGLMSGSTCSSTETVTSRKLLLRMAKQNPDRLSIGALKTNDIFQRFPSRRVILRTEAFSKRVRNSGRNVATVSFNVNTLEASISISGTSLFSAVSTTTEAGMACPTS